MSMSEELTTREAAQIAGLSREQLLRRVERGEIEGRWDGTRWWISRKSVEQYRRRRIAAARLAQQ
jgi:excisionase family DNA binding protein